MIVHSIKTDNADPSGKIYLRQEATKHLSELRVLDLFAGENYLWSHFKTSRYYGIEKEKGKGKNLNADNNRVIQSLNLSDFNVIDVDSYGVPFNQIVKLFENSTLQSGTVIIYTCITNKMSALNKECLEQFKIEKMYKKAPTLFNGNAIEFFYAMLYNYGIRNVYEYEKKTSFIKKYGYFVAN